jgi:hypothetical protein
MAKNNTALLACLLLVGAARSAHAQPFQAGDYVDVQWGGVWTPCKVITPLLNNGIGVSCGAMDSITTPQHVRARAATAEDGRVEAETALALAQIAGRNVERFIANDGAPHPADSPGMLYGTREPKACPTRTAPAKGAPSAEQAKQYVVCESESVFGNSLFLVTNVKVQVAPTSHPPNQFVKEMKGDLDPSQPVWDIRGSLTQYQCSATSPALNPFARTHNCVSREIPTASGYCYRNTFGDWHCAMIGAASTTLQHQLPPDGN